METTSPTSVSTMMGMPVIDPAGRTWGRVSELAVDVANDTTHVAGFIVRRRSGGKSRTCYLAVDQLSKQGSNEKALHADAACAQQPAMDDLLLMDRDVLDQQIIDVDGRKVVRVNDVELQWEATSAKPELRIDSVEVGVRGAARRLLKGLPTAPVLSLTNQLPSRPIPWSCVDLIDRDPARRVKLKIGQERLAQLHPSDIAAILEELAPAEREAVFTSLPEETAAEALEEIDPKMQKSLLQGLDSEHAASIIEEMDPGAAADLLSELSDEESEAILEEMEPEGREEMEELLEFSARSAAGRMTTDFVSLSAGSFVGDAIEALRAFEGDADTITEIYLVNDEEHLKAVVTLPRLLLAKPDAELSSLSEGHIVSCDVHASDEQVAELFDKYNLRSLAVVDHNKCLSGVIHAEQVIAQLREG